MSKTNKFAACPRLNPLGVDKDISAADLVDRAFLAYNGGRLREAARLLAEENAAQRRLHRHEPHRRADAAGLGKSCLIPLMRAGFVDWIVLHRCETFTTTCHYGLDLALYQGSPFLDDVGTAS